VEQLVDYSVMTGVDVLMVSVLLEKNYQFASQQVSRSIKRQKSRTESDMLV